MSLPGENKTLILAGLVWLVVELLRAWNNRRKATENTNMEAQALVKVPHGIKETDELVTFLILLAKGGIEAGADVKLDVSDIQKFLPALLAAGPALEGIAQVPAELWDLDSDESVKIVGRIAGELALPSEKAKKVLIASLEAAIKVSALVAVIVSKE